MNLSGLSNLRVYQKGLLLVGVPLAINFLLVVILFYLVLQADKERLEEIRYKKIAQDCARIACILYDAGHNLHMAFSSMSPTGFKKFKEDIVEFVKVRTDLYAEADKDPATSAKYHEMSDNNNPFRTYLPLLTDLAQHKLSPVKLLPMLSSIRSDLKRSSTSMTASYKKISEENDRILETAPKRQAALRRMQFAILFLGIALNVTAAIFLARFFMTYIVERLQVMTENAKRLANEQPLNPLLDGKDEIAELDSVFHAMADALAKAAQKERAAFDHASDVICVLDADGNFTRINAACERLWGRPPREIIGKQISELIASEDVEPTRTAVKSVHGESPSAEFENRIKHSDGHEICLLWSVYWSDQESALFCVAHDITERKQAEQMKQEFLGMVSHDLRSPLTSIYGVFQLLNAKAFGELPEMAAAKLGMAAKNVNRLLNLVNDLLDIEKLEAGQMDLQREVTSVADVLKRSVQDIEALAEQKKIKVEINCQADVFSLDLDRMMQVLVNLLSNAIKFSPEGGTVTLSAQTSSEGLDIKVKDQGRGVPASHRDAIFERFKQVEAADGKRKSGTGLGLPICKQIVELHGGVIGVDSEEGQGSTFWIKIPLLSHEVETTRLQSMPKVQVRKPKRQAASGTASATAGTTGTGAGSLLSRLTLPQKGSILVGVPVVLGLIFVSALTVVLLKADAETAIERHNRTIALNATKVLNCMYEMGTAMAGEKTFDAWRRFDAAANEIPAMRKTMDELTRDDPHLHELNMQIEAGLRGPYIYIQRAQNLVRTEGLSMPMIYRAWDGHELLENDVAKATPLIDELVSAAQMKEADSPTKLAALRLMQGEILLSALVFSITTSVVLAIFFGLSVTRRLYVLRDNSQRLAADRPLNPPLPGKDEIAQLDAVFHSMATTLKEARQKERAVFDNSQDVICALDEHGIFQQVNPASEKMWGIPTGELLKRSITDIIVKDDLAATESAIQLGNNGAEQRSFENRVACKDGTTLDMLWSASWSPSERLFFCTAHDISKRKEVERLKQDFLAMVSHDLRTPLTAIVGIAKLGTAGAFGPLPEKAGKQLEVVTRNVDRLLNLINDLLDMEKLESGQMQKSMESISAHSLLERSCQALDTFAEQHNVKLVIEPTDASISADSERLIQVLVNLLSNAIKFSPKGGTVTLSAITHADCVELKVSDQGRGIPDSFKDSIFERYKQVETADGKRKTGTGLGLPICKQIVLTHGGTIGVESEVGKGSTFWFRIPTAQKQDPTVVSKS